MSGDSRASTAPDTFLEQVQDALEHLHDPTHLQTHPLARLAVSTGATRSASAGKALRQSLEEAIESLRPTPVHDASHRSRGHDILRLRYLEALDVKTILNSLAVGRSEYYRDHRQALEAVTAVLRERWGLEEGGAVGDTGKVTTQSRDPAPGANAPNNLPLSLTSFVGREREIQEVVSLLETTRLLSLTGSGGCGKTRLAIEVARGLLGESSDDHPDGIYLVELASLRDPDLVPLTVALALGLHEVSGESILDTLLAHLRTRSLLLLLDNCEHLVDASARLADSLLRACPGLAVLATSREALGIGGEVAWSVPVLTLPPESWPSLEGLGQNASVRLFVDRASAVRPRYGLTVQSAPTVARICRLLDGMPLAIELAAARVKALTPEQIAERLDKQLDLLTGGSRTAVPRQQTLKATIDWSYELLAEPERLLFRRLAVFSGGFTLEAAEAVCSNERVEHQEVLDLLSQLVDKSLVRFEAEGVEARYSLLEPIRQYARSRLEEAAELDTIRDRHRDWYLGLAEEAAAGLHGVDQGTWLDRLETDHDNLRGALGWCLDRDDDAVLGLRLAASLGHFWWLRGYYSEGRRWLEAMLGRNAERTAPRAKALEHMGCLTRQQGDFDLAASYFVESLEILRQIGDKTAIASVLFGLGVVAEHLSDPGRAEALFTESLALCREVGDERGTQFALGGLGSLAVNQGDLERGRPLLEEALPLARKLGDRSALGWTSTYLAKLAHLVGETERARDLYEQSLDVFREIGERQEVGWVLLELARLAVDHGDSARAVALLTESLAIGQALSDREATALFLYVSATLATKEGKLQRGARLAGAAENHIPTGPLWTGRADCHEALETGRSVLSKEVFDRAWAEGQAMTLEQAVEYAIQVEE